MRLTDTQSFIISYYSSILKFNNRISLLLEYYLVTLLFYSYRLEAESSFSFSFLTLVEERCYGNSRRLLIKKETTHAKQVLLRIVKAAKNFYLFFLKMVFINF